MLAKLPYVLRVAGDTIRTDFPGGARRGDAFARQGGRPSGIERTAVQPPTYFVHPSAASTGGIYELHVKMDALKALSVQLFGARRAYFERRATSGPGGSSLGFVTVPEASRETVLTVIFRSSHTDRWSI
jgi:hypothetical protein